MRGFTERPFGSRRTLTRGIAMLTLSRRLFVASLAGLLSLRQTAFGQSLSDLGSDDLLANLKAFVDVIVPADETPSASDLGVHLRLIEQAEFRQNYPALISQGTLWLDEQARMLGSQTFALLAEDQQISITSEAFASADNTLPRVFADFLRQDVMRLYYQQQGAWGPMLAGPPQPSGHAGVAFPPDRLA